jgi:hypothetical protein
MDNAEIKIIQEIKDYITRLGGLSSAWYIGIARNPRLRLFNDHAVNEKNDEWIFRTASNSDSARNIEQYLIEQLGTAGDTGGGDEYTKAVYAYKTNLHTNP